MMTSTKLTFNLTPITILRDDLMLASLPTDIQQKLGSTVETGFHLGLGRRDIFCEGGLVQYVLGAKSISVELS